MDRYLGLLWKIILYCMDGIASSILMLMSFMQVLIPDGIGLDKVPSPYDGWLQGIAFVVALVWAVFRIRKLHIDTIIRKDERERRD